jgi:REP element-mobilizing transposase RayT
MIDNIFKLKISESNFFKNPEGFFKKLYENSKLEAIEIKGEKEALVVLTKSKLESLLSKEEKKSVTLSQAQEVLIKVKNKFKIFNNLSDSEILSVIDNIKIVKYSKNDTITAINSLDEHIHYIISGQCSIFVDLLASKEVATLKSGEFFGEMAYILKKPRTATVKAKTDLVAVSFTIRENIIAGSEKAYMKLFHNVNEMLANKIVEKNSRS